MSSLSTLPKGDSAWLLRKSIQRIMQQVSVLETNIGSSTTGNSANTQVIFNDAGTLRGDTGLTFNKTTDLLTVGAATITGDLTVDTSTLYVSSSADKVAIGTTSLSNEKLTVAGNISANAWLGRSNIAAPAGDCSIFRSADNTLGFGIASSTAMTLNATGLGVGTSPTGYGILALKKDNTSAPPYIVLDNRGTGGTDTNTYTQGGILFGAFRDVSNPAYIASITVERKSAAGGASSTGDLIFGTASTPTNGVATERLRIDSSGNVGIGVTPSAWAAASKAIDVDSYGANYAIAAATQVGISRNCYYNGTNWIYKLTTSAQRFEQDNGGGFKWFVATSGNAGDLISFGDAKMTLDASGNLLVAKTSYGLSVGFAAASTGSIDSVMASAVSAQSTLNVYSTGAAAYRFYVGMNGTINATNTTISAISDARLKENVQDIDVGLGAILALKPRKFDWKAGKGKDIKGDRGFIAQEFEQVFPQLVDEWKDEAPEGEAPYKSVRQDLIPVLVKAIQELTARVQTLETR